MVINFSSRKAIGLSRLRFSALGHERKFIEECHGFHGVDTLSKIRNVGYGGEFLNYLKFSVGRKYIDIINTDCFDQVLTYLFSK